MLHYSLQILEKKTKNVLENGLVNTGPGFYVSAVQIFSAISPFPTVFSTCFGNFLPFSSKLKLSSANSFTLEKSKICCLGKG